MVDPTAGLNDDSSVAAAAAAASRGTREAVVQIRQLNHYFGEGANRKQVLFDTELAVFPGEFVIMTGPSGSGKTTLLTLIGGLRSTQEGSNRVLGRELRGLDRRQLVAVRRSIGFIFQLHNLFESLSACENVQMALELQNLSLAEMKRRACHILQKLGLGHRIHHKPRAMSGGERQRVAVARALANRPQLVLADEPTAALDRKASRDVIEMLSGLTQEAGCAVLMVSHDSRLLDVAHRIINMVDGRVASDLAVNQAVQICEFLKKSPVFAALSPAELLNVAERMKQEEFSANTRIIREGEEGDKFYIIGSGNVDVHVNVDPEGRQTRIVDQMGAGDFFGEKALITGEPRNASIVSRDEVVLYSLGKEEFQAALAASDSFHEQLRKVAFGR
jgi:putative ABC transport system ATP-binding protein